jgi:hypothetical protein
MMRRLLLVVAVIGMVPACSAGEATTPVPPPPSTLEKPARQPWGDAVGARVGGLAGHIHNQLRDDYGVVRETHYVARDAVAVAGLEGWYGARFGKDWQRKQVSLPPEEHGFARVSGKRAFAVGWLDPLPDGRVPVVTLAYDGD